MAMTPASTTAATRSFCVIWQTQSTASGIPLMEWGWDREACIRTIEAAGLPQPGKSSCFFCPSMRAEEIIDLRERYPDLFRRALALEDNARANLKTVRGLGRNYSWKERFGKEQCNHGND